MTSMDDFTLLPYQEGDETRLCELLCDSDIRKTFMIPEFQSQVDCMQLVHRLQERSLDPQHYERGIYDRGQLVGFVNDVAIVDKQIELGYVIHPTYQHRGYATQALTYAMKDLFQKGYRCVLCGAFETNIASIRVMEKCGMVRIDRKEDIEYQGKVHHCVYYAITNPLK